MLSAVDALERLRQGNARFVSDTRASEAVTNQGRRTQVATAQEPFAIILGCSDSRVPGEIIFDQGLGDLFVIRVAGNVVAPSQIGSVEFAAERFGTRLVVVLGHTMCGAISATLEELGPAVRGAVAQSPLDRRPHPPVHRAAAGRRRGADCRPTRSCAWPCTPTSAPRSISFATAPKSSKICIQRDGLLVVGAEYSLETGVVEFFDGLPR